MITHDYRPIYEIAREIRKDYAQQGKQVYFGAVPYLEAAASLTHMSDKYICDDASNVLMYLLSNLQTWRGDTARRVKAEIKSMLAGKPVKVSA